MDQSSLPSYLKSIENLIQSGAQQHVVKGAPTLEPSGQIVIKDSKKLQFMIVGTHCHQFTGYSKVTWGIIQQLAKLSWLQVTHFGFQKFNNIPQNYRQYPSNVDVIDAAALEKVAAPTLQQQGQGFGFSQLPEIIRKKQPNVIMI